MNRVSRLVEIAQKLANERPSFFVIKGAGDGDRDTNSFMTELRARAEVAFSSNLSEKRICGPNQLCVDFFFEEERTIVEVALSLRNPNSEFERDILKVVMAKESGSVIHHLLFLSKPGASKKHSQPSSQAIIEWLKRNHEISVEIRELANNHEASS